MEEIRRIPRPMGTTQLSRNLYQDPTKKNRNKLNNHLIKAFINQELYQALNQGTHLKVTAPSTKTKKSKKNNKYIELDINTVDLITHSNLALGLGFTRDKLEHRITKLLIKESTSAARIQGIQDIEMITRGEILRSFFGSLGKVPEMSSWATELQSVARLKGYQPGFVMGANTAILNAFNAEERVLNMAMKLGNLVSSPKGPNAVPTNIQNNIYGTIPGQPGKHEDPTILTPTMAVRLLEEKGLTKVPLDEAHLAQQYGIFGPDIPDVKALPTDAQGANNFRIEDIVKVNKFEDDLDHHDTRREREEGIIHIELNEDPMDE